VTSLSICTAVCGAVDITERWISETLGNCYEPRQVCVAYNGCTQIEIDVLTRAVVGKSIRSPFCVSRDPQGSAVALNDAVALATGDVVAILHNDLMLGPDWDRSVVEFFITHPKAGVVGFAGAKKLGRDDIYRSPYQLTQLAREDVWTSLTDWQPHGKQATKPVRVAVLDGLAICLRAELWRRLSGFDTAIGRHHQYDQDLSLRALEAGFTNYVIPVSSAVHVSGQTANGARYQAQFGPDSEVHRVAHENMYRKWQGKLPVWVS
jgi:GT2 family glycosyltransferase